MHKHLFLFFSVLVFFTGCGGHDAPEGVIPRQQMVSLLTEVHLTDGALANVPQIPDSLYKYGSAKYGAIFKRYNVTPRQFESSLKYYTTRPEEFVEMYTKIAAIIKSKSDSLNKSSIAKPTNVIPAK